MNGPESRIAGELSRIITDDQVAEAKPAGEIVTVKNGPFKGRTYRRNSLGQLELIATPKRPLHRRRNA